MNQPAARRNTAGRSSSQNRFELMRQPCCQRRWSYREAFISKPARKPARNWKIDFSPAGTENPAYAFETTPLLGTTRAGGARLFAPERPAREASTGQTMIGWLRIAPLLVAWV